MSKVEVYTPDAPKWSHARMSAIDQQLLRSAVAGKQSPADLSAAVNNLLTQDEAVLRLKEIRAGQNLWDLEDQRFFILQELRSSLDMARQAYADNPKLGKNYLDTLRLIGDRLDKTQTNVNHVRATFTKQLGEMTAEAIRRALDTAAKELAGSHEIEYSEINGVFMEAYPEAVEYIESRTH